MTTCIAATENAIVLMEPEGANLKATTVLEFVHPTSLALDERSGRVYAGTRGQGVWASMRGRQWERLRFPEPDVFSVAVSPVDGTVYAGCEPSRLYCSGDSGHTWRELPGLRDIPSRPSWRFPPRPWTSHVRAIAPSPHDRNVVIVGIELGGLMLSTDAGKTWLDHRPGAQRDVHAVLWHPVHPNRVYEAGGGGAAWSCDGGCSWQAAGTDGARQYTWALAADPDDPDCWFVSAASGPGKAHSGAHADACIVRLRRDGQRQVLCNGLPQPLDSMPYALFFAQGVLYTGLKNGELYASGDRGDSWFRLHTTGDSPTSLVTIIPLDV